jgi:hypothetical protein
MRRHIGRFNLARERLVNSSRSVNLGQSVSQLPCHVSRAIGARRLIGLTRVLWRSARSQCTAHRLRVDGMIPLIPLYLVCRLAISPRLCYFEACISKCALTAGPGFPCEARRRADLARRLACRNIDPVLISCSPRSQPMKFAKRAAIRRPPSTRPWPMTNGADLDLGIRKNRKTDARS